MSVIDLGRGRAHPRRERRPPRRANPAVQLALTVALLFAMVATQLAPVRRAVAGHGEQAPAAATTAVTEATPAPTGQLTGYPSRITDGDTFRFGATRIRLQGIDAPEMSTPQGEPAKRQLADLVADSPGPISCDDTGQRSYDRVVARCFTADGRDLGAAMVEAGWARDWPRFSHGRYALQQARALAAHRGMYAG